MPMFTYTPNWEAIIAFYRKFKPCLPDGYNGLAGIRLHRTGNPLTFDLFGKEISDKPLYPLVVFELKDGEPVKDWSRLELEFDVPWVRIEDYHRLRDNVMKFYHEEDILEPRAEAILKESPPPEELIRKALIDHCQVLAEA